MKVYLSKLWIVNCIGAVVLIIAVTIAYIVFFVWGIRTWALFEVLLPTIVLFLCAFFMWDLQYICCIPENLLFDM